MHKARGRLGAFTLVELLVVVAIIGTLAGFLVPNIIRARVQAKKVQCLNNVKGIGAMLQTFSDNPSKGGFPFGNGKAPLAFESLQKLVDEYPDDLKPAQFICPESDDFAADTDEKNRYLLSEDSCSYAYLSQKKRSAKGTTILLSDDSVRDEENGIEVNHEGGWNVYYGDNSAKFLDRKDFPDVSVPPGLVGNHN